MLSFFTTFLTLTLALSSISGASAASIAALAARGVYSPAIGSPDSNTVWSVGKDAIVSW